METIIFALESLVFGLGLSVAAAAALVVCTVVFNPKPCGI